MKKFSFAKIVSLIFVCALLMGAFVVSALAADGEETTQTPKIVAHNVYYGDTFQIMYAIDNAEGATLSASCVVNGENKALNVVPFLDENGEQVKASYKGVEYPAYIVKEGFAAQAIDTVVTLTVSVDGEVVAAENYSVLQYTHERLEDLAAKTPANDEEATKIDNEIAMIEAFTVYAKYAESFIDGETTISESVYVEVVDGTIDGVNNAGMFVIGSTPFANIVTTLDYDNTAYNVEWTVSVNGEEAVTLDNETVKTLSVTGDMVITAVLVESECAHEWSDATCDTLATCSKCGETTGGYAEHTWNEATCEAPKTCAVCGATEGEKAEHTWNDATCEAPKTCAVCGATEGEVGSHADNNGDLACDTCEKVLFEKVTLTFDDTGKRTSFSTTQQVWTENGIVFTNDKASSSNDVADYANPVRCYKGSTITIVYPGMKQIVITCSGSGYAGITATDKGTLTTSGSTVTITFEEPVDSVTLTCGDGQARINKIDVVATICNHEKTETVEEVPATCISVGYTAGTKCADCGRIVEGVEEIPTVAHTEETIPAVEATCGEAGATEGVMCSVCETVITKPETVPATGDHADEDSDGLCDVCGHEMGTPDAPVYVDKTYSYTFSAKQFTANGTKALNGVNWTLAGDGGYWGNDGTKGQQFGSGAAPYKTLTLTSDEFTNVKTIKINTSGASSINATFTVWVNGVQVGESTKLTTTATTYTFELDTPTTGTVEIRYTQSSSKAIYIKSLEVAYQVEAE